MPRISIEDRSASAFRAGTARREPPRHLRAPAKRLWREIVDDRPVDWFRPGSYELLEQYVEFAVQQRALVKALARLGADDDDYPRLLRSVTRLTLTMATLSVRLRLSVQSDVDRRSGKTAEKGDGERDRLLGGAALRIAP
jgi:hypothetical protein